MRVIMTKFIKRGNMGARMTEICKKKKKRRRKMGVTMNKLSIKDENGRGVRMNKKPDV